MSDSSRKIGDVTRSEALSLLSGVALGRIVFTENAMPAVRPASHIVEAGDIIARSHDGSVIVPPATGGRGRGAGRFAGPGRFSGPGGSGGSAGSAGSRWETVVAYQADEIDMVSRLGWSVVVTGPARPVLDPAEIDRFATALSPWSDDEEGQLIRIHPGIVTGYRLIAQPN